MHSGTITLHRIPCTIYYSIESMRSPPRKIENVRHSQKESAVPVRPTVIWRRRIVRASRIHVD